MRQCYVLMHDAVAFTFDTSDATLSIRFSTHSIPDGPEDEDGGSTKVLKLDGVDTKEVLAFFFELYNGFKT